MNEKNLQQHSKEKKYRKIDIIASSSSEWFFTILPFIVFLIIYIHKDKINEIIFLSEWSFASAILNGQSLVRFISKILESDFKPNPDRLSLVISIFIVLLLVPSLIILAIVVMADQVSFGLAITQMIVFGVSSVIYLLSGRIIQEFFKVPDSKKLETNV